MLGLGLVVSATSALGASIHVAQGIMAGEVTATSALLQTRLTAIPGPDLAPDGEVPGAAGFVQFEYAITPDFQGSLRTPWLEATAAHDFIVRAPLTGLRPGTVYHYRPIFGADRNRPRPGPAGRFATLPGATADRAISFIVGSCMHYHKFMHGAGAKPSGPVTATATDQRLGYPAFAAMAALQPDFFVGTGDIVYYDHTIDGPAQTVPQLRLRWHEQFRFPRLIEFFARTPAYWSKDDHDFRYDDADLQGERLPLARTGIDLFREQMPILPADDRTSPTYRTHRVTRHLQIWLTEGRDHRSPNRMPDGPEKSLWGREQREWLQTTLRASDATWKILINPTPLVGPDDLRKSDNHTNLTGFRHEADAFFAWLQAQRIAGLLILCGDRHWQYHSVHPSGAEEFGCGALNDENSRVGVAPGSPKGTDPEARVRQPYTYPSPTGGFIRIGVGAGNSTALVLEHHDDTGRVLNTVRKPSPRP